MARDSDPDPIDIQVGLRMRALRDERRLSQAELGARIGVTFQQVQKYERGVNRISASMLVRAAKALGVKPSEMLPDTGATDLAPSVLASLVTSIRGAKDLVETYGELKSPRLRRAVLDLAKMLLEEERASGLSR